MLIDAFAELSRAQDLAQTAATYLATYSYDTGAAGTVPQTATSPKKDVGFSDIEVIVTVTETFASLGSATLQVDLIMADNAALTTNKTVLVSTQAIALATLVAGYQFAIRSAVPTMIKRYISVQYVIGTATTTAGKCSAFLGSARQNKP